MEEQRYPLSVRMVGVLHKGKSKMYVLSVLWSDQNDIVIYRTLKEFKKMHRQMKKAFPPASKLKKSDRIIPRFRDKKMKNRSKRKKGPSKDLYRLKFLQKYSDELLSCDPRVGQSADLVRFFHPKDQDLQPEFNKNGIMIMPSEDEVKPGHSNGNVTSPFVTETYRCVAKFETKDTKNKPFKVDMDEKVDVLIKDKAGWWLVEKDDKRMAWFPAPYLEKLDDDGDEDETDGAFDGDMAYTAVKSYKATNSDEISVNMGSVVDVLQKSENGWWLIRYNGKVGYIPAMHLKPYNYPHLRLTASRSPSPAPSSLPTPLPTLRQQQSHQLSHSQGNLLQLPTSRSPMPSPLLADSRQRSRSLNILQEHSAASASRAEPPIPLAAATNIPTPPPPLPNHIAPPAITVQMEGEEARRDGSFTDDSFDSGSTDFSLSDDLSSSNASSVYNLRRVSDDERAAAPQPQRFSHTPTPRSSDHLSPTSPDGKMIPSVSDPNLYKGPATPKVPPRPRVHEIHNRCTSITRKNAARNSPTIRPEILSH